MKALRRTLSFGKSEQRATRAAPAPTAAAAPEQQPPSSGRKLRRSLSFSSGGKQQRQPAAPAALVDLPSPDSATRRLTAAEFAAGGNVHQIGAVAGAPRTGAPLRRANSFGRSAKPSAPAPAAVEPAPVVQQHVLQQREAKLGIAESQCAPRRAAAASLARARPP